MSVMFYGRHIWWDLLGYTTGTLANISHLYGCFGIELSVSFHFYRSNCQ